MKLDVFLKPDTNIHSKCIRPKLRVRITKDLEENGRISVTEFGFIAQVTK